MRIQVDRKGSPVYEQITGQIRAAVAGGELLPGERLPTVRELADELSVARGTVKHAYDRLANEGIISMEAGRGTFVREAIAPQGKKDSAMAAIDSLLDYMESLGFTHRESSLFLGLKLRERENRAQAVRVLLVDCNAESLALMGRRVSAIPQVEIDQMKLEDALGAFSGYEEGADLVVTTATHYQQLLMTVADRKKVMQIVLSPSRRTVMELARAEESARVGILCASTIFGGLIVRTMRECGSANLPEVRLFSAGGADAFLADKDMLIVPQEYRLHCSVAQGDAIARFVREGKLVVEYDYQIDEGSFLRLEERVEQVKRTRQTEG